MRPYVKHIFKPTCGRFRFSALGADPLVWSPPIECIGYARVSTDDQRLWTCNADALERFKGSAYETESFPFMVFPMADHWPQVCPARRQRPQEWPKPPQTNLSRRIGCLTDHLPTLDVGEFWRQSARPEHEAPWDGTLNIAELREASVLYFVKLFSKNY